MTPSTRCVRCTERAANSPKITKNKNYQLCSHSRPPTCHAWRRWTALCCLNHSFGCRARRRPRPVLRRRRGAPPAPPSPVRCVRRSACACPARRRPVHQRTADIRVFRTTRWMTKQMARTTDGVLPAWLARVTQWMAHGAGLPDKRGHRG